MMETKTAPADGLQLRQREPIANILNRLLADEYLLYTKTRKFHWNILGPRFNDLHKFFEQQYEELNVIVDQVAERVRSVGYMAWGTLQEFLRGSRIKENPGQSPDAGGMLRELLQDHEAVIARLREDLRTAESRGDFGTNSFLANLLERHEKMAWMIRSFIQA